MPIKPLFPGWACPLQGGWPITDAAFPATRGAPERPREVCRDLILLIRRLAGFEVTGVCGHRTSLGCLDPASGIDLKE